MAGQDDTSISRAPILEQMHPKITRKTQRRARPSASTRGRCIVGPMKHLPSLGLAILLSASALACSSGGTGSGTAGTTGTAGASAGTTGTAGASAGATGTAGASAGRTGTAGAGGAAGHGGAGGVATAGAGGGAAGAGGSGGAVVPPKGPCAPPADINATPIAKLGDTGCMDPVTPTKFVSRAIPYEVNSPLWSDGADKTRAMVLPTGGKIHVRNCATAGDCPNGNADDGKWVFPVGTVLIKNFLFDGKLVETRLFMRIDADNWIGYGYEWNEAQTEAMVAPIDRDEGKKFNTGKRTVTWNFPSRSDCLKCHDPVGGSTLGLETAQLNRTVNGANQLDRWGALTPSIFETPPAKPYKAALETPYVGQAGAPTAGATLDQKARSYLHANCSFCHRPADVGGTMSAGLNWPNFDLRYEVPLAMTKICNVATKKTATMVTATKILDPGSSATSAIWQRMHVPVADTAAGRMPQIGSAVVDTDGTKLIADWIDSVKTCP
jgi:hypothetical protein